jgi:hypothetical protein
VKWLSIAVSIVLLPVLAALDAPAQSPQGVFDASDKPKPIVLPTPLKNRVPPDCPVRDAQRTMLSRKSEFIITCTRDFLAAGVSTHILVTDGQASVLKDIDLNALPADNGGGFNKLEAAKEVINESNQHVFVVVFSTAGDGSGSAFFVIGYKNGEYHVLLDRSVSLGRIVFHPGTASVDIWGSASGKCPSSSCVWCLHRYKIETYSWQSGRFIRKYSRMTRKCLNPDPITSHQIIVDKKHS